MAYEVEEEGSLRRTLQKTPDAKSIALLIGLKAVFQGMNLILLLPMTGSLSALDHASCARKPRLLRPLRLSNTKPETWEVKCEAQHQFLYSGLQSEPVRYGFHGKTFP